MKDLIANMFYKLVDAEYARIGGAYRDYGDVTLYTLILIVIMGVLLVAVVAYLHIWLIDRGLGKMAETDAFKAERMTYYDECVSQQNAETARFELELTQMTLMNELCERFDLQRDPFKELFADFPRIE